MFCLRLGCHRGVVLCIFVIASRAITVASFLTFSLNTLLCQRRAERPNQGLLTTKSTWNRGSCSQWTNLKAEFSDYVEEENLEQEGNDNDNDGTASILRAAGVAGRTTKTDNPFQNQQAQPQQNLQQWILVVDDEPAIRQAVGQYLYEHGYRVTACPNTDAALQILGLANPTTSFKDGPTSTPTNTRLPDAIVSDIRMPGKDGLQLLSILRNSSHPSLIGIPVLLLTAKATTEDRIAGYNAGADAYLPKPFHPEELLSILQTMLDRHRTLNGQDVQIPHLTDQMSQIKHLLLERGGGGVGRGWVTKPSSKIFFTPEERIVLTLLAERGWTNREMAKEMGLSRRRVEQHVTSLFRKVGVSNRTELVRWAIATGQVDL